MNGPHNRGSGKENPNKNCGNELALGRDTRTLSSRLIEDRCYLDLFLSPSLSPFVGCGVCGVLLLIAIRIWWSITMVWSALI
ncbi:hypothetical protein GIB67_038625 [Kingdonia uniflora]|uniref:Uncharacterized protein n=1 Tax=Kingdonia uniflora TaxID=39325 RepID=A0A7J7NQC5_9MAGN|nr:hypothetical protein GIB67_038625 [Kingdonia uniflora]